MFSGDEIWEIPVAADDFGYATRINTSINISQASLLANDLDIEIKNGQFNYDMDL